MAIMAMEWFSIMRMCACAYVCLSGLWRGGMAETAAPAAAASSPSELKDAGNKLFTAGKFAEAADAYTVTSVV